LKILTDLLNITRKERGTYLEKHIFGKGDRNGTNFLTQKNIKNIIKKLGIKLKKKELLNFIAEFDQDKDGAFHLGEFSDFLKYWFRKEEIVCLFKKYALQSVRVKDETQLMMTPRDLIKFFLEEQKQKLSLENIKHLSDSLSDVNIDNPCISIDLFNKIIFSPVNMIFNTEYLHEYQVFLFIVIIINIF